MSHGSVDRNTALPFPTLAALRAEHGRLLKQQIDSPDSLLPKDELAAFIERGKATGQFLEAEEDRLTAQTVLDYWSTTLYRAFRHDAPAQLQDFDPHSDERELEEHEYPYRDQSGGLANQGFVLDTERVLRACHERLDEQRLAAIVGAAGSGKNSVLRGLLESLRQGALVNSAHWRQIIVRLGDSPLQNLVAAVVPAAAGDPQRLADEIERMQRDAGRLAALIADGDEPPPLIVVTEFEQIFNHCDDIQRAAIAENLLGLIDGPKASGSVVLVMDASALWRIERLPELAARFREALVLVAFNADELRDAIVKPAAQVGLKFDEDLVDAIISDVAGDPAALALLQFTLRRLWELRDVDRITWRSYIRLGGGGRLAVATTAEEAFQALAASEQKVAEAMFRQLVRPNLEHDLAATQGVLVAQLVEQGEGTPEVVERVLEAFEKAHLIQVAPDIATEGRRVRIALQALASHWPRLVGWIGEERDAIRRRLRVADATKTWLDRGRDANLLWRGALLEDAESYQDLNESEREFVQASRRAVEEAQNAKVLAAQREAAAERKLRRRSQQLLAATIVALVAVVCALAAVGVAFHKSQLALREQTRARDLAEKNGELLELKNQQQQQDHVELMVTHSNQRFEAGDVGEAAVWAAEALRETPDDAMLDTRLAAAVQQHAHLDQLWHLPPPPSTCNPHNYTVTSSQYDPAGARVLITSGENGGRVSQVHIYDASTGKALLPAFAPTFPGRITWGAWSRNNKFGDLVFTGCESPDAAQGEVQIWDVGTTDAARQPLHTIPVSAGGVNQVVVSPSGRYLVVAAGKVGSELGDILVWDVEQQRLLFGDADGHLPLVESANGSSLDGAAFFPAAVRWVAFADPNAAGAAEASELNQPALIAAAVGKDVYIWSFDPSNPRLEAKISHEFNVNRIAFDADGRSLVTASGSQSDESGETQVWQRRTSAGEPPRWEPQRAIDLYDGVTHAEFSRCGRFLLTASHGGSGVMFHRPTGRWVASYRHGSTVFQATFSPDMRYVATASRDAEVKVWEVAAGSLAMPPLNHETTVGRVEFSPDGTRLLTQSRNLVRQWDLATGNPPRRLLATRGELQFAALSHDGALGVTIDQPWGSEPGGCRVWSNLDGEPSFQDLPDQHIECASFCGEGDRHWLVTISTPPGGSDHPQPIVKRWPIDGQGRVGQPQEIAIAADVAARGKGVADTLARIDHIAASHEGTRLAIASGEPDSPEGSIFALDKHGEAEAAPRFVGSHPAGGVLWLAFDPKAKRLVTASSDDTARVWNVDGSPSDAEPLQHAADVVYAEFSPDGRFVATASMDQNAGIWDAATGANLATIRHSGYLTCAVFDATGQHLVTTSHDGQVRVWQIGRDAESRVAVRPTLVCSFAHGQRPLHAAFAGQGLVTFGTYLPHVMHDLPDNDRPLRTLLQIGNWRMNVTVSAREDQAESAELLGARHFDPDRQDAVVLTGEDLAKRWSRMRKSERSIIADTPDAKAQEAELTEQWFAAAWHLNRLHASDSRDQEMAGLHKRLAEAHANRGNWGEAIDRAVAALESQPDDSHDGLEFVATCCLATRNARTGKLPPERLTQYTDICTQLLDEVEPEAPLADLARANQIVWLCSLGPDGSLTDEQRQTVRQIASRLYEQSQTARLPKLPDHRVLNSLGAAQYRAGDFAGAITSLEASEKIYAASQNFGNDPRLPSGKIWNWVLLSMAYASRGADGDREQADRFFTQSQELMERKRRLTPQDWSTALGVHRPTWQQNLALALLYGEATRLRPAESAGG